MFLFTQTMFFIMRSILLFPNWRPPGILGSLTVLMLMVVGLQMAAITTSVAAERASEIVITGLVRDQSNATIPGVSVLVNGTTRGVTTDADGKYKISVIDGNSVLVFSSVGYQSQEVVVGTRSEIDIVMVPDDKALEEVVVVGYGTQKKVNLTGSVATIGGEELTKRTATNAQNLLQGRISGLQVTQSSGKPGDDNSNLRIRGVGTFSGAGSGPLVLINGVQGDMSNLAPNDIESVTVLKDAASAAIYGARAANGVILVTTKKGQGKQLSIELNSFVEAQQATLLPKLLTNSADYMQYWNEGKIRAGQVPYFTQQDIDAYRNGNDPVKYPNYNWIDNQFRTALAHNHNLGISGGTENTSFNLSLGYLDQGGVTGNYDYKRYNTMFSIDTRVKSWLTLGGNVQLVKKDIMQSNFNESDEMILAIYGSGPNYTPTMQLPDGSTGYVARYSDAIGEWTVRNPESINASGFSKQERYNVNSQVYADVKLGKNLTWSTKGAVGYDNNFSKLREHNVNNYYLKNGAYAHNNATWHLGLTDRMGTNLLTTLYSTLNFTKTIRNDHYFNVLGGYNQESNVYRELAGSRMNFPIDDISELNAGAPLNQSTSGRSEEWAIRSLFARFMYDFKGKYLFEVNARYDGTSRIAADTRWGLFPSVSAGWRLSEEDFLKNVGWLSNLKLRASYGRLGNQNIGLYPYQDLLTNTSYPFSTLSPGVILTRLVDKKLRWETTSITDFGLDLNIKNGLFTLTADWFDKVTDDILYQIPIPASVGLSAPTVNYGKMKNTGWEFEAGHNRQIGQIRYGVSANFTTFQNKVLRVLTPSYGNNTIQEGLPFNSFYLIEMDGIFQNQAEIDGSAKHPFNPKPGDLKYKDANGDGVIDSKDRVVVDGAYAKFYYGGSINLGWKNFDLSAFFQGVHGQKFYNSGGWGSTPYVQGSAPSVDFVKNRWTGEGSSNTQPAMFINGYLPVTGTASTYWLYDASYLRMKNITLGYNFPKELVKRIGLKDLRLYVASDNLLTFTKYPNADPERTSSSGRFSAYPQLRTFALGAKVKF
jgi:TonB-linked SusC/RagA family outer membrane protein